ncbi:hypothetical protein ACTFIW_000023 [Dictyostelium discoideum]
MSDKVEIVINTARPGLVIGKKGSEIEVLRNELPQLTGKEIWIEVEEIKRPDLDAKVVADGIARQLERQDVLGEPILLEESVKEGVIQLQTMRADIDYALGRAETTYGSIGVKANTFSLYISSRAEATFAYLLLDILFK